MIQRKEEFSHKTNLKIETVYLNEPCEHPNTPSVATLGLSRARVLESVEARSNHSTFWPNQIEKEELTGLKHRVLIMEAKIPINSKMHDVCNNYKPKQSTPFQ